MEKVKASAPRGRKKGDGRGRLGGRAAGTPNKEKPLKTFLREHSLEYFTQNINPAEREGLEKLAADFPDRLFSQYEIDLMCMKASDRVKAELDLLNYHTAKMQATSIDMTVTETNQTLVDRIKAAASNDD